MAETSSAKSEAEQIVDVQRAIAGPHPGFRTVHAKGIVCTGTFVAGPEAKRISKAAHFQGQSVPVTLRFSNGSGDPSAPDGAPDARGLAVKFLLADGRKTDLLAITNEAFLVRTAEDFLAFLRANLPDPATGKPNPDAVPKFVQSHPAVGAFVGRLMQKPIPVSLRRRPTTRSTPSDSRRVTAAAASAAIAGSPKRARRTSIRKKAGSKKRTSCTPN